MLFCSIWEEDKEFILTGKKVDPGSDKYFFLSEIHGLCVVYFIDFHICRIP